MKLSIKRTYYTRLEMMFILLWTFYSVYYFLFHSSELSYDYYSISKQVQYICNYILLISLFVFWMVSFYQSIKWRIGDLLRYIVFLFLILLIEINIREVTLMIFVLFVMSAQFMDFDKLLRYDIKVKLIILAIIFVMCALGIVKNVTGDYTSGYKQAFGFSHPNTMACYVVTILVEWLCIRYKEMKWYDWSGIIFSFLVLLYFSNSRVSIYTFIVIFFLFLLANLIPKVFYSRVVKMAFAVIAPLMAAFSLWAVRLYGEGNSFIRALNSWMSGRIELAYYAVTVKGIKLFGQEMQFSSRYNPVNNRTIFLVDNAYVRIAITWGFIIFILIIIAYSILFIKLINRGEINLALMSLFFVILGFGEIYMTNVLYNLTLLCLLNTADTKGKTNLNNIGNKVKVT